MEMPKDALEAAKIAMESWGLKVEGRSILLPSGKPLLLRWHNLEETTSDLQAFHGMDAGVDLAAMVLQLALTELYGKKPEDKQAA